MSKQANEEAANGRKISVSFTQQQWQLLDRLKSEERWGATRDEIVRNVFADYVKQELGE
jgi:hypothetical protein